jgi:hypothetical protein
MSIRTPGITSTVRHYLNPSEAVTKYREHSRDMGTHPACRRPQDGYMKRTLHDEELPRAGTRDIQAHGISRLDREALEGVMRDDVFRAADGKALGLDPSDLWPRRATRRA